MHITAVRPQGTTVEMHRSVNMAIYKVTDLKTGEESVQVNLEELYTQRKNATNFSLDELEKFAESIHENEFAQDMAGVTIEVLDNPFDALADAKAEYTEKAKRVKTLKPLVQKLTDESLKHDKNDLTRILKYSIEPVTKIQKRVKSGELKVSDARREEILAKQPRNTTSNQNEQ